MSDQPGLRERKKRQTRAAISQAAVRLFSERGYDAVTIAEIADVAGTAVTTVFSYFPDGKEALIFGEPTVGNVGGAEDRAAQLVAAVRDRPAGRSPLGAVADFIRTRGPFQPRLSAEVRRATKLITQTPALRAYARRRWVECEDALTAVLAEESGREPDAVLRALARIALEVPELAGRERDPSAALTEIFERLESGWHLDG